MKSKFAKQIEGFTKQGFRPVYYYLNNGNHTKGITVCLLFIGADCRARGISICSSEDVFVKSVGRLKALGRAIKALTKSASSEEINYFGNVSSAVVFKEKSTFYPILTPFETKLIKENNRPKKNLTEKES